MIKTSKFFKKIVALIYVVTVFLVSVGNTASAENTYNEHPYKYCINILNTVFNLNLNAEFIDNVYSHYYTSNYEVPYGRTDFYGYMDLYTITDTTSKQYQQASTYWLDSQGLWRYGDDYVVAMGTYYTAEIGARFSISTDKGNSYNVFVGDIKADIHTDDTNRYVPVYDSYNDIEYKNVIEFIVNTPSVHSEVAKTGNIGNYENIGGNITSISKIG